MNKRMEEGVKKEDKEERKEKEWKKRLCTDIQRN